MKLHLFPSRSLAVSDTELLRRVWAWYLPSLAWLVASSEIQWKLMSLHRRYQSKSSLYRSCPGNKTWNEKLDEGFLSRSPTRLQIDRNRSVTVSYLLNCFLKNFLSIIGSGADQIYCTPAFLHLHDSKLSHELGDWNSLFTADVCLAAQANQGTLPK